MSMSGQGQVRWGGVFASALAAVSWAYLVMAGIAALGLHLLGADAVGELGPMTAAAMVLSVGGTISPSGDVAAFGLEGSAANAAVDIAPLGISAAGALVLGWLFVRSLRAVGPYISPAELAARAGTVVVLFTALLGGLAWAGSGKVTIDGKSLPLGKMPGGDLTDKLPGGFGDIGGGLPDALGDLAGAKTSVGFEVHAARSVFAGLAWVIGVLIISLAASRLSPLPRGWEALHRTVRPAASALRFVVVLAWGAGLGAGAYAAVTEDAHKQIFGAALIGAPNGTWLALPIGLFVPWHGSASGQLAKLLPDPMDKLLTGDDKPITLSRLADLDGRVWLLAVATALMMLTAGVLTASRTPVRDTPTGGYAAQCAVRLGVVTALALPMLSWLTELSADASLSMFGVDAVGAGVDLHGSLPWALLLGALWGAGAGFLGALLARASGAAGLRAAPLAAGQPAAFPAAGPPPGVPEPARAYPDSGYQPGPYNPQPGPYQPQPGPYNPAPGYQPSAEPNPYASPPGGGQPPAGQPPAAPNPYEAPTTNAPPPPGPPPPPPPGRPGQRR